MKSINLHIGSMISPMGIGLGQHLPENCEMFCNVLHIYTLYKVVYIRRFYRTLSLVKSSFFIYIKLKFWRIITIFKLLIQITNVL